MKQILFNISLVREVLKVLYESSNFVNLYVLYERYSLLPYDVYRIISILYKIGYIVRGDFQVSLTMDGRKYIFSHRKELFAKVKKYWKQSPAEFTMLKEEGVYLPSFKTVRYLIGEKDQDV